MLLFVVLNLINFLHQEFSCGSLRFNGLTIFFRNGKPVFCNDPTSLPKNPPDCTISTISISVNELFLKFLQGLKNVDQLAMIYAEN